MNALTSSLPRILFHNPITTNAKVVVLIPPPVDEGAEPINIKTAKINDVIGDKSAALMVENPALRVERELKISAIVRSPVEPYIGLFQNE